MLISVLTKSKFCHEVEHGEVQARVALPDGGDCEVCVQVRVSCTDSRPDASGISDSPGRAFFPAPALECRGRLAARQGLA
eukprot:257405-Alexandrium_andersonii.AAC.1